MRTTEEYKNLSIKEFTKAAKRYDSEHIEETQEIKNYTYTNDTGDAQSIVYHVFPGVEVAYTSVHMADFDFDIFEQGLRKNYGGYFKNI